MEIAFIPRFILASLSINSSIQKEYNILFSNIVIIISFLIFKNDVIVIMNLVPHFCLFERLFGIDCPVCGITRAFCQISEGEFINAYILNLSSFIVGIYFIFQVPLRICSLINNHLIPKVNLISKRLGFFAIGVILVNWLFYLLNQ